MIILQTLRERILLVVFSITLLSTAIHIINVKYEAQKSLKMIQEDNARNVLNAVYETINNQHKSIKFYQKKTVELKKEQLKNVIDSSQGILRHYNEAVKEKKLTLLQAQHEAKEALRKMNYGNDNTGYLWISTATVNMPHLVMHPHYREFEGQQLTPETTRKLVNTKENVFERFAQESTDSGEAFITYDWENDHRDGKPQKKLSFIKLFKPWNWVVGTGTYISEIEHEANSRIAEVITELSTTYSNVRIGDNGYVVLFNRKKEMLIHPEQGQHHFSHIVNKDTGGYLMEELIQCAHTQEASLEYRWTKPHSGNKTLFKKKMYMKYFEPLDWYVGVGYYQDDLMKPLETMISKIICAGIILLVISSFIAIVVSSSLTKPLRRLIDAALGIQKYGVHSANIPIDGSAETQELGKILNETFEKLDRNEQELKAHHNHLRITLNSIADAVIVIEEDGSIDHINAEAQNMLGHTSTSAILCHFDDLIQLTSQGSSLSFEGLKKGVINAKKSRFYLSDGLLTTQHGKTYHVEGNCAPLTGTEDKKAFVLVLRDMTEVNRIKNKLKHISKMDSLGQLAGGIAHDFNNMLTGIIGANDILQSELKGTNYVGESMTKMISQICANAADLTKKLLIFSRKSDSSSEPIDVNQHILDSIAILERTLPRNITINYATSIEDIYINADPGLIQNLILNLGINAGHAMEDGGSLAIYTRITNIESQSLMTLPEGKYIEIEIKDTGAGIPLDIQNRIFEPFFTTKTTGKGTGLGLSTVYGSIQDHKGDISVNSTPGNGTTFSVFLPVTLHKTRPNTTKLQMNFTGKGRILVIDDESVIRKTLKHILEKAGFEVMTASSGIEGMQIYTKHHELIDLVILDMIMPEKDGDECFQEIRALNSTASIIIASGCSERSIIEKIDNDERVGVVTKPYHKEKLFSVVSELIDCP